MTVLMRVRVVVHVWVRMTVHNVAVLMFVRMDVIMIMCVFVLMFGGNASGLRVVVLHFLRIMHGLFLGWFPRGAVACGPQVFDQVSADCNEYS